MRKITIFLTLLILTSFIFSASAGAEAVPYTFSVPTYYEKISDNEWYTDEFTINDSPTEILITVTFEKSSLSFDDVFSTKFFSNLKNEISAEDEFDRFVHEPEIGNTERSYRTIYTSYITNADGEERGVMLYYFFSENERCTFRFDTSNPMFFVSGAVDEIINSIYFSKPFFSVDTTHSQDDTLDQNKPQYEDIGNASNRDDNDSEKDKKSDYGAEIVFVVVFVSVLSCPLLIILIVLSKRKAAKENNTTYPRF